MKAMLLAAGKGERMRPLTLEHPKPLLPVGGKALIDWHLERLSDAGIDDIVINVSWLGDQIREHCGNGERWGVRIRYSVEDEPLETAGGIVQALPLLGEAPFLVLNADIFTDFPFAAISGSPGLPGEATAKLVLVPNPSHNRKGDFSLQGARVVERGVDALTYAGIGLYHPAFFAGCAPGKRPLLPLLLKAIAEHRLQGERFEGVWTDVGTPGRLQSLNASLAATNQ